MRGEENPVRRDSVTSRRKSRAMPPGFFVCRVLPSSFLKVHKNRKNRQYARQDSNLPETGPQCIRIEGGTDGGTEAELNRLPSDLRRVHECWATLPPSVRSAVVALVAAAAAIPPVASASGEKERSSPPLGGGGRGRGIPRGCETQRNTSGGCSVAPVIKHGGRRTRRGGP